MNPIIKLPDGIAEFIILVLVAMFFAFLWFQKEFGKNKEAKEETEEEKKNKWSPANCALATEKAASIFASFAAITARSHDIETQMLDQNKALMKIIEDNTRANTILAERLK